MIFGQRLDRWCWDTFSISVFAVFSVNEMKGVGHV